MEDFIYLLNNINLFKSFKLQELGLLFKKGLYKMENYKKNSIIYFQNSICDSLDVILNGNIIIQKVDSMGNIMTMCSFTDGEVISENLIFSINNSYPMTVIAKSECTILHIKKELVLSLCQKNVDFLYDFLQSVSNKSFILTNKIQSLSLKTIRQYIKEYLNYEYLLQKNLTIKLQISKTELAEKFGIKRPSLSRELAKMRDEGLLTFNAKSITIKNIKLFDNL